MSKSAGLAPSRDTKNGIEVLYGSVAAAVALLAVSLALPSCGGAKQPPPPEVIAHRGFWNTEGIGPGAKNSVAALRAAISLGCWGAEFDVWVTADGVPVVFHDARTATGIEIQNATLEELMAGAELLANGERIPTLDEYLAAWNHAETRLILELKSHRDAAADQAAATIVLEHLRARGIQPAEIEFIAFSPHATRAFASSGFGSPVAYLNGDLTPAQVSEQLGADGIDYNMSVLRQNPDWIDQAHALGMTVNVWTVVDQSDIHHFTTAGVDRITTDTPDLVLALYPRR